MVPRNPYLAWNSTSLSSQATKHDRSCSMQRCNQMGPCWTPALHSLQPGYCKLGRCRNPLAPCCRPKRICCPWNQRHDWPPSGYDPCIWWFHHPKCTPHHTSTLKVSSWGKPFGSWNSTRIACLLPTYGKRIPHRSSGT